MDYQTPTYSPVPPPRRVALVYDITDCGPNHKYAANGVLVHNSDSLNVQNLPKRGGADTTIRQSMLAPIGCAIVSCDSSQIEARLLAWMAGQDDLVQLFAAGGDPYSDMAAYATGRDPSVIRAEAKAGVEPGKTQRDEGKATVLGAGFNMGPDRYQEARRQAGHIITSEQAAHAINAYRQKNSHITNMWRELTDVLRRMLMGESFHFGGPSGMLFKVGHAPLTTLKPEPYVELPNGTRLWYEALTTQQGEKGLEMVYKRADEKTRRVMWSRVYGGFLTENLTQALAFAALKWQVFDTGFSQRWKLAINVHDSWSAICKAEDADACLQDLLTCMSTAPPWLQGMPFAAEGSISDDYAGAQ